jgi:hypothetical protein
MAFTGRLRTGLLNGIVLLRRKHPIASEDWAILTANGKLIGQPSAEMSRPSNGNLLPQP